MKENCNNKWCCYLYGLLDLVCFVGGAYLLSAAIFGGCCGVIGNHIIPEFLT